MAEILLRMLGGATVGLALVLLLRRPARRAFGAGPAFTLWLLPVVLALAPLLPREWAPAAMVALRGLTVTPHGATTVGSPMAGSDWAYGLVALWLAGAAIALLRLAVHYVLLLRGLRVPPVAWLRTLEEAMPDLDAGRVRIHDAGPAVLWALPRSLVLLPADFTERFDSAMARGLVLRHESTHARRGDALWSLAMEIASALLWFHPLAWLARPRFRLDQELACDAASLRALPLHGAHYARALLDSVAVQPAPALIPWLAEPQLKERIAMITRIPPGMLRRRIGWLAIPAFLGGVLFAASGIAAGSSATPAGPTPPSSAAAKPVGAAIAIRTPAPGSSTESPPLVDVTYKNQHPPKYPIEAIQKGEQGMVMLDVTIDAAGRVTGVAIDPARTTAPAVLQTAAIRAAADWEFKPGVKDGHAVGGTVNIPVNFSLSGESSGNSQSCPAGFTYKQGPGKSFSCEATFDKCAVTTDSGQRDSVQAASCTEDPAVTQDDAPSRRS